MPKNSDINIDSPNNRNYNIHKSENIGRTIQSIHNIGFYTFLSLIYLPVLRISLYD